MKVNRNIILILFLLCAVSNSSAQYYYNQYAYTDGVNDYFYAQPHAEIQLDSAFTIEGWVIVQDTLGNNKTLLSTVNGANSEGYALMIQGASSNPGHAGKLQLNLNGTGSVIIQTGAARFPLNTWTHFAVTFQNASPNNDTVRFYINAVQVQVFYTNIPPITNSTEQLRIGNCYLPNNFVNGFKGFIDDLRIYKRQRTAAMISNDRGAPVSLDFTTDINTLSGSVYYRLLTAAWPLNGNGEDNVGFSNDLTAVNGATYSNSSFKPDTYRRQSNYYCRYAGAGWLSGADATNSSFDLDTAGTLEAWVYIDAYRAAPQTIICKGTSSYSYILGISSSPANSPFLILNSGSKFLTSSRPIKLRTWTHIAATYRSSSGIIELYTNGVLDTLRSTGPGNISLSNDSVFVGRSLFGDYMYGRIDELRISKFVKSQSQIKKYLFTNLDNLNYLGFGSVRNNPILRDKLPPGDQVSFGFEGNLIDMIGLSNNLIPRGSVYFEWMNLVSGASGPSQAPLIRTGLLDSGFISSSYFLNNRSIPIRNNTSFSDSIPITGISSAYSVTVFVLLNHTYMDDVDLILRAPNGMNVNLSTDNGGAFNDLMTVFDDQADSAVNDFNSPYSMKIKPQSLLSTVQSSTPNGYWRLTVSDDNATNVDSGFVYVWGLKFTPITGIVSNNKIPGVYRLYQNFPNPFNPDTKIKFDIPSNLKHQSVHVKLTIYDIRGKEIEPIVDQDLKAGSYDVTWEGTEYPSGIYFYRLDTDNFTQTGKMILLK